MLPLMLCSLLLPSLPLPLQVLLLSLLCISLRSSLTAAVVLAQQVSEAIQRLCIARVGAGGQDWLRYAVHGAGLRSHWHRPW